jgi:hypothetical protein
MSMERNRHATFLSAPGLWLLGVSLFLPTVRACERMESPASLVRDSWPFAAMLAPYLLADVLLVLVVIALCRVVVPRFCSRAMLALVPLAAASPACLVYAGLDHPHGNDATLAIVAGLSLIVAVNVWIFALRGAGWRRMALLVATFAILSTPLGCLLALIVFEDGPHRVGIGAYTGLVAFCWLDAVALLALWPARRKPLADDSAVL